MAENLKDKVINASKWSVLAELIAKALSPLIFLVLARLLTPEDYGVMAVGTMLISFSQFFWDLGFSKALIQRQDAINERANVVFWTNIVIGLVLYSLTCATAELIAEFFGNQNIVLVIKILGFQIVLSSLGAVQTALFQRDLNFKILFRIRIITTVAPAIVSITLAWLNFGYWALVGGTLLGTLLQSLALWYSSPWRPSLSYNFQIAKDMFSFGIWIMAEGLLSWGVAWIDSLIVGKYLGPYNLGLYNTGNNFVTAIFGLLISPILPVVYSYFAQIQNDSKILKRNIILSVQIMTMFSLPIGVLLYFLANFFEATIFGAKWVGIAPVLALLGIIQGISWIASPISEAYRSIGRADITTKIMLFYLLLYTFGLMIISQYGFNYFLYGRLVIAITCFPIHFYVLKRVFFIDILFLIKKAKRPILATLFMAGSIQACNMLIASLANENNILSCFVGVLIYGVAIFYGKLNSVEYIKNYIMSRLLNRRQYH